ncbi:Larval cuticle protein LCP-22 [Amphibalanus amphitrite]|uniref:Larval cuticle protein LCP-22 n=1 Tax=Amphibalanus amphitrite TaxID=1232801 RepID=A0A6A4WLS3_AMPAM|nr:Larval cuticle protein LCP-22 [Amphibalanus amphitrite]
MKLFLLASLVVLAAARPQDLEPQFKTLEEAGILRMDSTMNEDGSFQYGFETTDPIQQDVAGQPKQIGEEIAVVMQGSYSFQTPEGQTITIDWVADEKGFQPQGDAIPVAPEAPNAAVVDPTPVRGTQRLFTAPVGLI